MVDAILGEVYGPRARAAEASPYRDVPPQPQALLRGQAPRGGGSEASLGGPGKILLFDRGASQLLWILGNAVMLRSGLGNLWLSMNEEPVIAGTGEAWEEVSHRLRSFIAHRLRSETDAEDIVQEVPLRVHRSIHALKATERIHAGVYQIARNAIADHHRTWTPA